jgi:glycosyltransferase involved in cell wall biosynthesis
MTDIVIPARNEADTIASVVSAFANEPDRIIVVDDGSTDDTASVASDAGALVIPGPGIGKGEALTAGFQRTTSRRVVMCDGDLSGFTWEHAALLTQPSDGEIIGIPDGFNKAVLSGERSLPGWLARELNLHGWLAEIEINNAVRNAGLPVYPVTLRGVSGKYKAGIMRLVSIALDSYRYRNVFGHDPESIREI